MKLIISVFAAIALIAFVGCGDDDSDEGAPAITVTESTTTEDPTDEPD